MNELAKKQISARDDEELTKDTFKNMVRLPKSLGSVAHSVRFSPVN
jgi:hypothetical protein